MSSPRRRLPFRYVEPSFFGGLLDDPLLFLRIRPLRRALLFDCGQIAHLAKRVVKPIDAVFITHAHMDHIMGVPTLVRHHHASPRPLDLYGPPGIIERVGHLLMGFDWNLSEPEWFTLRVHEIRRDRIVHCDFPGPAGFVPRHVGEEPRTTRLIWSPPYATVEAELLDHKLPVLAFRVDEQPHFAVDHQVLERMGLVPGEWVRDLKSRVWKGIGGREVVVERRGTEGMERETVADPRRFYDIIRGRGPCASIGYLCDVGWTAENRAAIEDFLRGATLLCVDCTFLAADQDKARASYHLCTSDLNELARTISPGWMMPMHLSKSYLKKSFDLYAELDPPEGTRILRLPAHLVPAPLGVSDVDIWLRPV